MRRKDQATTLAADWSKREKDVRFWFSNRPDGHYLYGILNAEVTKELQRRGYDLTTLRFSIRKDPTHPRWAPAPAAEEPKR